MENCIETWGKRFGHHILHAQLYDAWAARVSRRQNGSKIQIIREDNLTVGICPIK